MEQLQNHTASELISLLKDNRISVEEIAMACINSINNNESRVRAWDYFDENHVLKIAKQLDIIRETRGTLKTLYGVPIGVKDIFIIGGGQIYSLMEPYADTMQLSFIKKEYEGNTFFPKINWDKWQRVSTKDFEEFDFVTFKRV